MTGIPHSYSITQDWLWPISRPVYGRSFKNVLLIDKNKKIDKRDLEDQIDFDEEDDDGDNDDDNDDDIINKYNPNDDDNDDDEEEDSDEIIKENKTKTFKK